MVGMRPESATGLRPWRVATRNRTSARRSASPPPYPAAVRRARLVAESHATPGDEPVRSDDLVDYALRDRRIGRDRHDREVAAALARRLAPDRGGRDVHAMDAERGAHAPDHPRHVLVAEQRQVALVHLQVEA